MYFLYNDIVAILNFTHVIYYMYIPLLFWISSYMYLCLISNHELLLSAAIIFVDFFVICMRVFGHFMELVDEYSFWALM